MNLQKFKAFLIAKKNYLIAASLLIIVILLSLVLVINSLQTKQTPDKTWQIELNYDQKSQKLTLDKLNLINGKYIPDSRNSLYSPYSIEVLDKNGKTLYSAKINVTEQVLYDLFPMATMPAKFSTEAKSVIFVPYELNSSKIVILKNNKNVLEVNLPQTLSFKFVQDVDAVGAAISCGPVTTVFINDNYTNVDQFKSDVSYLENLYNTTPPYNLNPSIFDFKEVDQAQNLGCQTTGIKSCIENKIANIKSAGLQSFPSAQKFIVLVDNPNAISVDGGLAGLVNGVGGDVIIYTNFVYPGPTGGKPFAAASHELEGHAIGYLWDRYVSSDQNYSAIPTGFPQSNCSTKSLGESFWPSSGSTGAYKGCANQNQYGPFPLTCKSYTSTLISGGTNDTIMSAIGCSTNQFDSVEQSWIRNNILPYYKPCGGTPQPTISPTPIPSPSPTPTQTPSPTPTPTPIAHSVKGFAFVDNNGNGQKDPGENPFPNLTVSLSGAYTATAVTDTSGNYSFNNLPAGSYTISANNSTYEISFGSTSFSINANTQQVTINFPVPAQALATPTPVPSQNPAASPTPTPTPSPVPFPTISATQASPNPSLSNPSATYTCVFDPSCVSGQSSIQICPLKCTPNP